MAYLLMGPCTWVVVAPQGRDYGYIGRMGMALSNYAKDHEGRLPQTLWALIPEYLSEEVFTKSRFCSVKHEDRFDWLYFPQEKIADLPPDIILLAAPGTFSSSDGTQSRLVWSPSGARRRVPEADFQRLIREQNPPTPRAQ